jgi:hypothetical protein
MLEGTVPAAFLGFGDRLPESVMYARVLQDALLYSVRCSNKYPVRVTISLLDRVCVWVCVCMCVQQWGVCCELIWYEFHYRRLR